MPANPFYPSDEASFDLISRQIEGFVNSSATLPDWPFGSRRGELEICQFHWITNRHFGEVLGNLSAHFGDTVISVLSLEPAPGEYMRRVGCYPAFQLSNEDLALTYWQALALEPEDRSVGALTDIANRLAIVGNSARWAVWAQRSWDLVLVLSPQAGGAWTCGNVEFVDVSTAIHEFTEPDFKTPLSAEQRATFLENARLLGGAGA